MNDLPPDRPDTAPARPADPLRMDDASAEAAAARIMAMHRAQQEAESLRAATGRMASGWIMVAMGALLGMALGAMMGAIRGHALGGAVMLGLVGALLAIIRQRVF